MKSRMYRVNFGYNFSGKYMCPIHLPGRKIHRFHVELHAICFGRVILNVRPLTRHSHPFFLYIFLSWFRSLFFISFLSSVISYFLTFLFLLSLLLFLLSLSFSPYLYPSECFFLLHSFICFPSFLVVSCCVLLLFVCFPSYLYFMQVFGRTINVLSLWSRYGFRLGFELRTLTIWMDPAYCNVLLVVSCRIMHFYIVSLHFRPRTSGPRRIFVLISGIPEEFWHVIPGFQVLWPRELHCMDEMLLCSCLSRICCSSKGEMWRFCGFGAEISYAVTQRRWKAERKMQGKKCVGLSVDLERKVFVLFGRTSLCNGRPIQRKSALPEVLCSFPLSPVEMPRCKIYHDCNLLRMFCATSCNCLVFLIRLHMNNAVDRAPLNKLRNKLKSNLTLCLIN
jgi:hypothetical protein